jgi:hypothetical protein
MQKGWWGKKEMTDPLTGKTVNAQLGSDRRLKTIYSVNMRSAYQKEQYDTRAVTEARLAKYKQQGINVPPVADGTGGGTLQVKTEAPPVKYKTYINERKGTVEQVPEGIDPAFNWNQGKAGTTAAAQKLADSKKNYEAAAAAKPKKEYLTKKKLEDNIAALDAQIKTEEGKKAAAEIEAKKAEYQKLLDTKLVNAEKKTLVKQQAALQKELDGIKIKTYSGIWKTQVTTADWLEKSGSLEAKKEYFKYKLAGGALTDADKIKFAQFIKDLEEFEIEGKRYYAAHAGLQKIKTRLTTLKKHGILSSSLDNAFTEARKNAALWAKTQKEADDALRGVCGKVWQNAGQAERKAAYDYTCGSGGFNRPLRGYDGSWSNFKGIGKVDLNAEGRGNAIKELTSIINKSQYDIDIWVQRGIETSRGAAGFLGIPETELKNRTQTELTNRLVDTKTKVTDEGFVSCGSAKGKGFSGYIFNIYCPKGTKMLYAEPFSHYGNGTGLSWDGMTKQASFGYEDETIIQRGTTFRVTNVEKKGGNTYFYIEVVGQIGG